MTTKSKPAAKPAKGKQPAAPVAAKKPAPKPVATAKPARDPNTVTIKGEGTIPVYADGAMRRLDRGKPVKVSTAELAFLKRSKVALA